MNLLRTNSLYLDKSWVQTSPRNSKSWRQLSQTVNYQNPTERDQLFVERFCKQYKSQRQRNPMDLESVKKYLEKGGGVGDDSNGPTIHGMPFRFFENFIMQGLRVDHVEKGRVLCTMKVPPRLLNAGNFLHGGATASLVDLVGAAVIYSYGFSSSGVSVEINVSYLDAAYVDEEIEIDTRALRVGKTVAVVSVEFRKKNTRKIVAQGRNTKYLAVQSKM